MTGWVYLGKKFFYFFRVAVFKSHHRAYVVSLAKRSAQESKQLYVFSHCFGNSNSCVQIKSCDNISDASFPIFYHKFGRQPFWIGGSIPGRQPFWTGGKHSCFTSNLQVYREIQIDISIFLGYSEFCCKVKLSYDFVPVFVLVFSLQFLLEFFLRIWSWILPFSHNKLSHVMSS